MKPPIPAGSSRHPCDRSVRTASIGEMAVFRGEYYLRVPRSYSAVARRYCRCIRASASLNSQSRKANRFLFRQGVQDAREIKRLGLQPNSLPKLGLLQFSFFFCKKQPALIQLRVFAVPREKLFVIPALDDLPSMKNQDLVSMTHS